MVVRYGYYLARGETRHGDLGCSLLAKLAWGDDVGFLFKRECPELLWGPYDGVSMWVDEEKKLHKRLVYTDWFDNRHPNNHPPKVRDL